MIEPTTLPLAPNINKHNVLDVPDSTCSPPNSGYPFQEPSSITGLLADFETFNINDENTSPSKRPAAANHKPVQSNDEVATLKAELEATRRKLADYEAHSNVAVQQSMPFTYTQSSRNCFPSDSSTIDFTPTDILPWSDYDSSITDVPPPPHPSPVDFPGSVAPLRLPSSATAANHALAPNNINPSTYLHCSN
jgi:hypothetical protein